MRLDKNTYGTVLLVYAISIALVFNCSASSTYGGLPGLSLLV